MNTPHTLMVQGTTSDAGKSVLVTALCRILARRSVPVAPFKPQNMALNSAVSKEGGEIGRAQAVQAQACFLQPSVRMNPILLKPNSDTGSQVIVNGQAIGNMSAKEYHAYKPRLLQEVVASYQALRKEHKVVIVEGAGSPAEINLRDNDIANMGFAEEIDCPVIIVADIDRGGVFAHLYGTWALLSITEKERVKGFVINRFRGDESLLKSAISWLEEKTTVPVIAVIPYIKNLHIEAEDSVALNHYENKSASAELLNVVVIRLPHISNYTDFDALRKHPNVNCSFVEKASDCQGVDLLIIPGSKNVRSDLDWLKQNAWPGMIQRHIRLGGKVMGLCGGYQMLGKAIHDPSAIEGEAGSSDGLGYIEMETSLRSEKKLKQVKGKIVDTHNHKDISVEAYEIHAGISYGPALEKAVFIIEGKGEGAWAEEGSVLGTYLHGLFDHPESLAYLLIWAGLEKSVKFDYQGFREKEINRLADVVEDAFSHQTLLSLLALEEPKP
ncbi:MAG: cobyric acid synthase [Pseudomonadales bacterium]|nr:cobyric acid synthase [Pseudomonadales bacterium]